MAGLGNTKHQAAVAATAAAVDELRHDITRQLAQLLLLNGYLTDLAGTRQPVGLGFQTPDSRAAADAAAAADRAATHGHDRTSILGQGWLAPDNTDRLGQSPAPVSIAATSAAVEILFALRHHIRRLAPIAAAAAADVAAQGVTTYEAAALLDRPPVTDADVVDLVGHLRRIIKLVDNRPHLAAVLRDLEHLEDRARDVIDGPARSNLPEPCPWCDRTSLVVHHRIRGGARTQTIRCEGSHPCECDWEWCGCHRNPVRNRHEWVNSGRATHTWHQLSNLQNSRKELLMLETRALDALDAIKALHQPTWTDSAGVTRTWFVYVEHDHLDELAGPHECITSGLDRCDLDPDDPTRSLHAVPGCVACQTNTDDGGPGNLTWPCPTYQLADLAPTTPTSKEPT